MLSQPTRTRTTPDVRVAALDTAHSRRRSAVLVGPLRLPPLDELAARYTRLAELGPLTRLCLRPDASTDRWRHQPVDAASIFAECAPLPTGSAPTDLLPVVRSARGDDIADGIRILRAGDHLAIDFCHGLGEVPLINLVLDVLLGTIDPTRPGFLTPYRGRPSLPRMAARTFGSDPRRIARLLDVHRRRPRPPARSAGGDDVPFTPSPVTRFVGLPGRVVDELRHRRDRTLPGVSLMALLTFALWDSFASVGLPVDDIVKIPFDARRYLPAGSDTLATFSAGLDFALDARRGPAGLQADMDRSARSARPVANLLISSLKARSPQPEPARVRPRAPRVRLLHSNVGRAAHTGRWPFTDPAAAHILVASDPISAEGVTVTSAWSATNLWLTAEFHGGVFEPDRIRAALDAVETRMRNLTKDRLG